MSSVDDLLRVPDHEVTKVHLLERVVASNEQLVAVIHASLAGARRWKRLHWAVGDPDSYADGMPAQGFLIVNDGTTDVWVGLSRADVKDAATVAANDNAFTVPAKSWQALPLVAAKLVFGGAVAGSAVVYALDKAPAPAFGTLAGGTVAAVGSQASGVADNGDGVVKVGGVQTNGNRRVLAMDNLGQLIQTLRDQSGIGLAFENGTDGQTNGAFRLPANAVNLVAIDSANFQLMRTPNVFKIVDNLAIGTETTIWTPAAGKKFRLMGFILTIDTTTSPVKFRDNTAGTTIFEVRPTVNAPATPVGLGNGKLSAAINNVLTIQAGVANNCHGCVWGTEE